MTPTELKDSKEAPLHLSVPLQALWFAAKGQWDEAHRLVQDDDSAEAAWVHAYLHLEEGDASNARYWYARAGVSQHGANFETEWSYIAEALLQKAS